MNRFHVFLLTAGLISILSSCQRSPDTLLLRQEGQWELKRGVYEELIAEDLISGRDTINQGTLSFFATGNGTWVLPDSSLIDLRWEYQEDAERMDVELDQVIFVGENSFSFRIVENGNQRQIWQSIQVGKVWSQLRQDSLERKVLVRWQLERE